MKEDQEVTITLTLDRTKAVILTDFLAHGARFHRSVGAEYFGDDEFYWILQLQKKLEDALGRKANDTSKKVA